MLDLPIGKALVPVESEHSCPACCLVELGNCYFKCTQEQRKDGKNVVFKLVDYPAKGE